MLCSCAVGGPVRGVTFSVDGALVFSSLGSAIIVHARASGAELLVVRPFPRSGSAVHGVRVVPRLDSDDPSSLTLLVFGGKSVSVVELARGGDVVAPTLALRALRAQPTQRDWILDAIALRSATTAGTALLGFSDNGVAACALATMAPFRRVQCGVRCMLRSMALVVSADDGRILVAGGTMTNEVLLWAVPTMSAGDARASAPALERVDDVQRLAGHDGTVYGVSWAPGGAAVCSVSDDRTARLWAPAEDAHDSADSGGDRGNGSAATAIMPPRKRKRGRTSATLQRAFVERWSRFGHSSRLWSCTFARSTRGDVVLTTSEDATCRVWLLLSGECIAVLRGHVGKHVWSISATSTATPRTAIVATGGGDGAVKLWSLEAHVAAAAAGAPGAGVRAAAGVALQRLHRASQHTLPLLDGAETAPRSAGGARDRSTEYVQCAQLAPDGARATLATSGALLAIDAPLGEQGEFIIPLHFVRILLTI